MDPEQSGEQSGEELGLFGVPHDPQRESPSWARDGVRKTYMGFAVPRDIFAEVPLTPTTDSPPADALSGSQAVDLNAPGEFEPAPRVGDQTAVGLADLLIEVQSDQSSSPGIILTDDSVVHQRRILNQDDFELLKDWIAPFDDKVITLDHKVGIGFNASQYDQMGKISLVDRTRPGGVALGYLLTNGDFDLRAIFQGTNSSEFNLGWHKSVPHNAVAMVQAIWPLTGGSHRHVGSYSDFELPKAAPIGLPMVCAFVGAQGGFEVYKTGNYRAEEKAKEVTKRAWLFFKQKQIIAQEVPESFSVRRSLYGPTGEVILEEDALMIRDDPDAFTHWRLQIGDEREDPRNIGEKRAEMFKSHYPKEQGSSGKEIGSYAKGEELSLTEDTGQDADGLDAVLGRDGEDAGKSRKDDPTHKTTRRTMRAKKGVTGQWELPKEAQDLLGSQGMEGAQVMESPLQGRGDMPDICVRQAEPTPAQDIKPRPVFPSVMGDDSLDGLIGRIHAVPSIIHERYIPDPQDTQRPFKPLGQAFYKTESYHLLADAGSETQALAREELRKGEKFHKKVAMTGVFIKSKAKPALRDVFTYAASDERFAVNIVSEANGTYIDVGEMGENPSKGLVPSGTVIYIPSDVPYAQEIVDGVRKDPLAFARAYDSRGFPAWFRGYAQQMAKDGISAVFGDSGPHKPLTERVSGSEVEIPPLAGTVTRNSGPVRTAVESEIPSGVEVGESAVILGLKNEPSVFDRTTYFDTQQTERNVVAMHYKGTIIRSGMFMQDRESINRALRALDTQNREYPARFGDEVLWGTKPADDFEVRSWTDPRTEIIGITYHVIVPGPIPRGKVSSAKVLVPQDLMASFKQLNAERQDDVLIRTVLEDIFKDYAQSS